MTSYSRRNPLLTVFRPYQVSLGSGGWWGWWWGVGVGGGGGVMGVEMGRKVGVVGWRDGRWGGGGAVVSGRWEVSFLFVLAAMQRVSLKTHTPRSLHRAPNCAHVASAMPSPAEVQAFPISITLGKQSVHTRKCLHAGLISAHFDRFITVLLNVIDRQHPHIQRIVKKLPQSRDKNT